MENKKIIMQDTEVVIKEKVFSLEAKKTSQTFLKGSNSLSSRNVNPALKTISPILTIPEEILLLIVDSSSANLSSKNTSKGSLLLFNLYHLVPFIKLSSKRLTIQKKFYCFPIQLEHL